MELTPHQVYVIGLLRPIHTLTAEGRALWTPRGRNPRPGERLANPDLARFLEGLADGESLYHGERAKRIAADMAEGGGLLGEADLAAYRVIEREPLGLDYRGHRLLTNPPPSFGGSLVGLSLSLLEERGEPAADLREHALRLAEVMQQVEERRAAGGTTHLSVLDDAGAAASLTLSNGEGSGYVVPGTGILLNNMLGEDDLHPDGFHAGPPGERVASMMSPSLVLRDGRVRQILGSGGSKRIRTAILQIVAATLERGLPLAEAVEAPRLHWDGSALQLEPGLPDPVVEALRARWPLNVWSERNLYFGGVHAVEVADPVPRATGDPRRDGSGAVLAG